jgi:hypothetical protein
MGAQQRGFCSGGLYARHLASEFRFFTLAEKQMQRLAPVKGAATKAKS